MVGQKKGDVSEILDESNLRSIVEKALGSSWMVVSCVLKRAADGSTGFMGDHFRATLTAKDNNGKMATLQLFVKTVPLANQSKADFIVRNNFSRREDLMFRIFEEMGGDEGPNAWRPTAYLHTDSLLVMPDLAVEGFAVKNFLETLALPDLHTVAASLARFHATFANYTTRKTATVNKPYNFLEENKDVLSEPTLCDSPWLRASAKLSANFLKTFSTKYKNTIPDLEDKFLKLYLDASENLRHYDGTLNVVIHRDLWVNNILFGKNNAILVDYQCVRYAPPAFDVTIFLYLTTTRSFRDAYEQDVLTHYYKIFYECTDEATRCRMKEIGYNEAEFLRWCELSRMFSLFFASAMLPYFLMDPDTAQRVFDDPETFERHCNVDRSEPVIRHARESRPYRERQLRAIEEFVQRYLLKNVSNNE